MLKFQEVVEGIRCRQLGKLFNDEYKHPLKQCILNENKPFTSRTCLKESADTVAKSAHSQILGNIIGSLKNISNAEIISDNLLIQQLGCMEIVMMAKATKIQSDELTRLVHYWGCDTFREVVLKGKDNRAVRAICKKVISAKYLRIFRALIQANSDLPDGQADKIKLAGGTYKLLSMVTSKEFRMIREDREGYNNNKLGDILDLHTSKEYFTQIKRLKSTKHKNTLLRVWNGDCLSNSRLVHFGIVDTNKCPKCDEIDTPEHMLINCIHARRVWELVMQKLPRGGNCTQIQYAMGINDSRSNLMLKAEILKCLMHFRELEPEETVHKSIAYLKLVNARNWDIDNW